MGCDWHSYHRISARGKLVSGFSFSVGSKNSDHKPGLHALYSSFDVNRFSAPAPPTSLGLKYGVSITGTCANWETAVQMLDAPAFESSPFFASPYRFSSNSPASSCDLTDLDVPVESELLHTISPQFIVDLTSWAAIGTRTTESQLAVSLFLVSGFSVGFKNSDHKPGLHALYSSFDVNRFSAPAPPTSLGLKYGVSITSTCANWETAVQMLDIPAFEPSPFFRFFTPLLLSFQPVLERTQRVL